LFGRAEMKMKMRWGVEHVVDVLVCGSLAEWVMSEVVGLRGKSEVSLNYGSDQIGSYDRNELILKQNLVF
jgi:hypothetical protein